jgi:hypothetical protein
MKEILLIITIPVLIVGGWILYNYIQDRVEKRKGL